MSQLFHTLHETNKMLDDVGRHNDNYAALRSSFSGTAFPPSPTVGQTCWRTDKGVVTSSGATGKLYKFSGNTAIGTNGWVTDEDTSGVSSEVINSRGTKETLDQRLDIALNEDGTLKANVVAYQSEWVLASVTFTYADSTTFTTTDNTSDIFLTTRRVKVNLSGSVAFSEVVSVAYNSNDDKTTVTLRDAVLDSSLVSVEHSIIAPYKDNGAISFYTRDESDERRRYVPMKVKVTTDVNKGQVVKATGYDTSNSATEIALTEAKEDIAVGLIQSTLTNGTIGDIVTRGTIEGLDTSSYEFGDILYSDGAGGLTSVQPEGQYQAVAYVLEKHSTTGAIMVNISEPNYDYLKADKDQTINTDTVYTDSATGLHYKIYVENANLVLEEL